MHPLRDDAETDAGPDLPDTRRDTFATPRVAAMAAALGLDVLEAKHTEKVLQRNQMALKLRVAGELREFGVSVFPLVCLTNHSCDPNAAWQCVCSGRAMVVRASRAIQVGEEVCFSYCYESTV